MTEVLPECRDVDSGNREVVELRQEGQVLRTYKVTFIGDEQIFQLFIFYVKL